MMIKLPQPNQIVSRLANGVRSAPSVIFQMASKDMTANAIKATPIASRRKRPNCRLKRDSRSSQSFCGTSDICFIQASCLDPCVDARDPSAERGLAQTDLQKVCLLGVYFLPVVFQRRVLNLPRRHRDGQKHRRKERW